MRDRTRPEPTLPAQAGIRGLVLLVALLVVTGLALPLGASLLDGAGVVLPGWLWILAASLALYGPLVWWCHYAAHRWGTGSVRRDLGLSWRAGDIAWGGAALLGAWAAMIGIGALLQLAGVPVASNTEGLGDIGGDPLTVAAVLLAAVVAAPVVEELFFRGLVLRSLRSRLAVVPALLVQGLMFGLAHFSLDLGWGTVGLVLALSGAGTVYGLVAWHRRSVLPGMVGHAGQNLVALVLALAIAAV